MKHVTPLAGVAVVAGGAFSLALAAGSNFQIEEVVVTAQKREQSLQDVPLSISALSGQDIAERNIIDPLRLAQSTPSLIGGMSAGVPSYYIRGVGTGDFGAGADPAVGIYLDGIYISRNAGSLISLLDVERVEVVKGPQGTLFGRNAAAGAISVITKKPSFEMEGALSASYGNYDHIKINGSLSGPLAEDTLAARLSFIFEERDGYVKSDFNGENVGLSDEDNKGVRLALRYTPSASATIDFTGDYLSRRPNGMGFLPLASRSYQVSQDAAAVSESHVDIYGLGLQGEFDLSDTLSLTSISAWRVYDWSLFEDDDALPQAILHSGYGPEKSKSFSQEVRLSQSGDGWSWFIGASAFYEEIQQDTIITSDADYILGPGSGGVYSERLFGDATNKGYAVYGDVTAYLTKKLSLTGGLRWGYDKKKFELYIPSSQELGFNILFPEVDPATNDSNSWDTFQPRLVFQYYPTDGITAYVSATKGYKAGGFNSFSVQQSFNPETIWSFEGGLKTKSSDGRFSLNIAGFYYNYDDLQVTTQVGVNLVTTNAAKATGQGIELEGVAYPVRNLRMSGALTWLDASYDEFLQGQLDENFNPVIFDRSGNTLVRAPKLQFRAGIDYTIEDIINGYVKLGGEVIYQGRTYFAPANDLARSQSNYAIVNLRVSWTSVDEHYTVSAYAENIFDEFYLLDAGGVAQDLGAPNQLPGAPRFYGVSFSTNF